MCSALSDSGVWRLLKALRHEAPSFAQTKKRLGIASGPAIAQVFKTFHFGHTGKQSIARVMSGEISDQTSFGGNRIGGLSRLFGAKLQAPDNLVLRMLGLVLVTPLLAFVGYFFLRDREKLDVFHGRRLWLRTAICTAVYIALWAPYGYLRDQYEFPAEVFQLFFIVPPMIAFGSLAALSCYEFDFAAAFLHYSFHLLVVLALCYVAGMDHLWLSIA